MHYYRVLDYIQHLQCETTFFVNFAPFTRIAGPLTYWTQSKDSTELNCLIALVYSLRYSWCVKSYSENLNRNPNSYTTFSTL